MGRVLMRKLCLSRLFQWESGRKSRRTYVCTGDDTGRVTIWQDGFAPD